MQPNSYSSGNGNGVMTTEAEGAGAEQGSGDGAAARCHHYEQAMLREAMGVVLCALSLPSQQQGGAGIGGGALGGDSITSGGGTGAAAGDVPTTNTVAGSTSTTPTGPLGIAGFARALEAAYAQLPRNNISSNDSSSSSPPHPSLQDAVGRLAGRLQREGAVTAAQLDANRCARAKLAAELQRIDQAMEALSLRTAVIHAHTQYCTIAANALLQHEHEQQQQQQQYPYQPPPQARYIAAAGGAGGGGGYATANTGGANHGGYAASSSPASQPTSAPLAAVGGGRSNAIPTPATINKDVAAGHPPNGTAADYPYQHNTSTSTANSNSSPNAAVLRELVATARIPNVRPAAIAAVLSRAVAAYTAIPTHTASNTANGAAAAYDWNDEDAAAAVAAVRLLTTDERCLPAMQGSPCGGVLEQVRLLQLIARRAMAQAPYTIQTIQTTQQQQMSDDNSGGGGGSASVTSVDAALLSPPALHVLLKLLRSLSDEVKAETLGCIVELTTDSTALRLLVQPSPLPGSHATSTNGPGLVGPLSAIIATTTSEVVLEKALVAAWHVASDGPQVRAQLIQGVVSSTAGDGDGGGEEWADTNNSGNNSSAGLRSLLDLLYTDALPILSNVCICIGYLTRDDHCKALMLPAPTTTTTNTTKGAPSLSSVIGGTGGLEKITATLRHPHPVIMGKAAAAVWNCAADDRCRHVLRALGAVPALLELVEKATHALQQQEQQEQQSSAQRNQQEWRDVLENATGALWNLTASPDARAEVLALGGVPTLVAALTYTCCGAGAGANATNKNGTSNTSSSTAKMTENLTGVLWNCSTPSEGRPLLRRAAAIPLLLAIISGGNGGGSGGDDTAATTSQAPHQAPLLLLQPSAVSSKARENAAAALRNCCITDQVKVAVRAAEGIEALVGVLREATALHASAATTTRASSGSRQGDEEALAASAADLAPVLEKVLAALWILTVTADCRRVVRASDGLPALVDLLRIAAVAGGYQNINGAFGSSSAVAAALVPPAVLEKLLGCLRNCASERESRPLLLQCGAAAALIDAVATTTDTTAPSSAQQYSHHSSPQPSSSSYSSSLSYAYCLRAGRGDTDVCAESVCGALWSLAREDKQRVGHAGAVAFLCTAILLPALQGGGARSGANGGRGEGPVAQALGALSSLTMKDELRAAVMAVTGNSTTSRNRHNNHSNNISTTLLTLLVQAVGDPRVNRTAVAPTTSATANSSKVASDLAPDLRWTSTGTVLNAVLVLRNCTAAATTSTATTKGGGVNSSGMMSNGGGGYDPDAAAAEVCACGGHGAALALIEAATAAISHSHNTAATTATANATSSTNNSNNVSEDAANIAKEVALILKNLCSASSGGGGGVNGGGVHGALVELVQLDGLSILRRAAAVASANGGNAATASNSNNSSSSPLEDMHRAASMALQSLQRCVGA